MGSLSEIFGALDSSTIDQDKETLNLFYTDAELQQQFNALPRWIQDAIANSPYTYDISPQHIQVTTDVMNKTGVGKMRKAPVAAEWVKTDLLDEAKKSLNIK